MSMAETDNIVCYVACALAERQLVLSLTVPVGTSYAQAVVLSKIANYFPRLSWPAQALAVYGEKRDLHAMVSPGERIEILRPLVRDPMSRRRVMAANP